MKKIYVFIALMFAVLDIFAQQNNSRLNVKSLKLIENDTEASRARKKDGNGDFCALLKIQTPNMNEVERNKLKFSADMGTFVYNDETAVGEVKLFLTEGCKTLIIMHPDYGKLTYPVPLNMEGLKTYEMVLMADKDDNVTPKTISLNSNYVIINVTPKDAIINVDGKLCQNGKVNLTVDEPHHLEVSHKLYHPYESEIHASATEKLKYDVNLAPAYGWLKINSKPESGAIVLIDGERKGTTPFSSDTLPSGEYEVKLMKDMYETGTFTVVVKDSKTQEIELPIKPTFAEVTVTTDSESDIYIDGEKKRAGKWQGRLTEGKHLLEARKTSHRTTVKTVDIIAGKEESFAIKSPVPIYGALDIQSEPDEAEVYLDGVKIGETPLKKNDVLVGNRTIRFEKKGCATLTKTYTVEENNMLSVYERLDSGRIISITTGRNGDKIYVDGAYAGLSPIDVSMGYGTHTVKAERGGRSVVKDVDVKINGTQTQLTLEFGKLITITTDKEGDEIYVDGTYAGESPLNIDLSYGSHDIKSVRDKKSDEKRIEVKKDGGVSSVSLYLRAETASNYVRNGITFVTANAAVSNYGTPSFGVTFGKVKKVGWFVSATTNFIFKKAELECDQYGMVDGVFPGYQQGSRRNSRLSLMGGVIVKLYGPLCMRAGAGYATNTNLWTTVGGQTVKSSTESFSGVDATLGMQLNLKGITLSLDMVTTNFKTLEAKIGVGACFKNKR
ncbi:MAG: PEGA domain-containing protein [Candidatus Limimorpha sp.]